MGIILLGGVVGCGDGRVVDGVVFEAAIVGWKPKS